MKMNKKLLSMAIGATLAATSQTTLAALPVKAQLDFDAGVKTCALGGTYPTCDYNATTTTGSYFSMDANGNGTVVDSEKTIISQNNGVIVDGDIIQPASGSHTGAPGTAPESPDIDNPWAFFGNTGMHQTTSAVTVHSDDFAGNVGLDFSGWSVTWNGIASIPMGGDTANFAADTGIATVTCAEDCADGDTYILDYAAHVPLGDASSFGGVPYTVHLEGTIDVCTGELEVPTAVDDTYKIATGVITPLLILTNDADLGCSGLNKGSVDLDPSIPSVKDATVTTTEGGTATVDTTTGVVTYAPPSDVYQGTDDFSYTVSDRAGNTSTAATVSIVVGDVAPTCNDDGIADGAYIEINTNSSVDIDVLANDVSRTYTIDEATVAVVTNGSNGFAVANLDGTITYTPASGFTGPNDSFTYHVSDNGTKPPAPLTCAEATVTVVVSNAGTPIGDVENAYLVMATGNVKDDSVQPALGEGTWFSMETQPGEYTYVPLVGFNHIQLGMTQPATSVSPITPNIDSPWQFFGNQGVHQTTSDLIQLSNDGFGNATLNFSGWNVSWNGIASIPMDSNATVSGFDDSVAIMTCAVDCADGDSYTLEYSATVPVGDASGFGGVHYFLHMEGTISKVAPLVGCRDESDPANVAGVSPVIDDCNPPSPTIAFEAGATANASGNTTGVNLTAAEIGAVDPKLNPKDGRMCVGGCLDFVISGITTDHADFVVKLSEAIPKGGVYRKLINGRWQDFDVSGNDRIGSAVVDPVTDNCHGPKGEYKIGLREGNQCLYMKIYDGGPNDADNVVGTITDPSGVLLAGSPNVPASSTDGCSVSSVPVKLTERADWLLVAAFIAGFGLLAYRRRERNIR